MSQVGLVSFEGSLTGGGHKLVTEAVGVSCLKVEGIMEDASF